MKINSDALRSTVKGILDEYGERVQDALDIATEKTGKEAAKELKKSGDFGGSGKFKKGWTAKKVTTRLYSYSVVYNKAQPGLAHLLEFGHAKRNGGRTKAFNFIAPVADQLDEELLDNFKNSLEG